MRAAPSYSAGFRNISDCMAAERQECVGVANMPTHQFDFYNVITEQLTPRVRRSDLETSFFLWPVHLT